MRRLRVGAKTARVSFSQPAVARCILSRLLALAAGGLGSCASVGASDVPPAYVATDPYQGMTCERMKSEEEKLNARRSGLAPALFSSMSEQERENRIAQINGELKALSQVSADKCGTRR